MRLIANKYKPNEIIKTIREWTELNQTKFGETINRSRDSINNVENGRNKMYLNTFIDMCNKHNIKITLEKEDK